MAVRIPLFLDSLFSGVRKGLIFDIGMNNGNDTDFYLAKGFHVVAVEANPFLALQL